MTTPVAKLELEGDLMRTFLLVVLFAVGSLTALGCSQEGPKRKSSVQRKARKKPIAQEETWEKLNVRVDDLHRQGRYSEAIPVAKKAVRVAEKTFGHDHPNTATSYNNLAAVYHDQGEMAEAELFYKRAVQINEKAFGEDHPNVARGLSNLALVLQDQGKYADVLVQRELEFRRVGISES